MSLNQTPHPREITVTSSIMHQLIYCLQNLQLHLDIWRHISNRTLSHQPDYLNFSPGPSDRLEGIPYGPFLIHYSEHRSLRHGHNKYFLQEMTHTVGWNRNLLGGYCFFEISLASTA